MQIGETVTADELKARAYMGHRVYLNGSKKITPWHELQEIHGYLDSQNRHPRYTITDIQQETETCRGIHAKYQSPDNE